MSSQARAKAHGAAADAAFERSGQIWEAFQTAAEDAWFSPTARAEAHRLLDTATDATLEAYMQRELAHRAVMADQPEGTLVVSSSPIP